MNLVKVSIYAEGSYSGSTYYESFYLKEETYNEVKEEVDGIEIYVGELDGKHSEVKAKVKTRVLTEKDLLESKNIYDFDDGDALYFELRDILSQADIKIEDERDEVNKYIDSLDTLVTFPVTIRKSQREKVIDFIASLSKK